MLLCDELEGWKYKTFVLVGGGGGGGIGVGGKLTINREHTFRDKSKKCVHKDKRNDYSNRAYEKRNNLCALRHIHKQNG